MQSKKGSCHHIHYELDNTECALIPICNISLPKRAVSLTKQGLNANIITVKILRLLDFYSNLKDVCISYGEKKLSS